MTDVAVKAINSGETSALETELSARVDKFVAWCVDASESIAHCGFCERNLGIGRVAHNSLRSFVEKKSKKLQPLALKRARKLTKKPGFFSNLFGGGGQSASEEELSDDDHDDDDERTATEIDEFADERSQSDEARAPEPEPIAEIIEPEPAPVVEPEPEPELVVEPEPELELVEPELEPEPNRDASPDAPVADTDSSSDS
jgi:hypothetical protein